MSEKKSKLSDLIKLHYEKAKKTINDKIKAESIIRTTLDEIKALLEGKVKFRTDSRLDDEGDILHYVYVENTKSLRADLLFFYYFHQETIFPLMINYQGELTQRCENTDELMSFIEVLVTIDSFMLKIIAISELDEDIFSDDIPF